MRSSPAMTSKSTMTTKPTVVGKPGVTAIPTTVGKPTATSEPAPVKTATHDSTTIGKPAIAISTVHIRAIGIATSPITGRGPTATIISLAKPTIVKTTAVKISGIPSFKERPIVSIVKVIPVMTIPDRIVIISISREVSFTHYPGSSRIIILILINGRRRRRRRRIIFLRTALYGNQARPDNDHKCK
jgi:hypothetical protein